MDEVREIQLEMARLGWSVEEKISSDGWGDTIGYSLWFRRSEWHGKLTYTITSGEVCFHGHTSDVFNSEEVLKTVKKTANRAKQAWIDFPDTIPYQNAYGEVRKATMFVPFSEGKDVKMQENSFTAQYEEEL